MFVVSNISAYLWPRKEPETVGEKASALAAAVQKIPLKSLINPSAWSEIAAQHPSEIKFACQFTILASYVYNVVSNPWQTLMGVACGVVVGGTLGFVFADDWTKSAVKVHEAWLKLPKGFQVTTSLIGGYVFIEISVPAKTAMIVGAVTSRAMGKT